MNTNESTTVFDNQMLYCERNKLPMFAYKNCPNCKLSLQSIMTKRYGSLQQAELKASSELFTGCNCGMSWCD